jgi:AcrR family transcriptional regulator
MDRVTARLVPSNPPTRRGRATREAFIRAARDLFLSDGYLNVTVPDIAASAGRSAASFYTYFDSKADLLELLADEAIQAVEAQFSADLAGSDASTPTEVLVSRISGSIWRAYRTHLPVFVSVFQTATRDLELQRWSRLRSALTDAIEEVDRRADASGAVPMPDRRAAARALASMFENTCFLWLREPDEPPGRRLSDDEAIQVLSAIWIATFHSSG